MTLSHQPNRARRRLFWAALAFSTCVVSACSQPVDCAAEPGRCVVTQTRSTPASASPSPIAKDLPAPPVAPAGRATAATAHNNAANPPARAPSADPRPPAMLEPAGAAARPGRAVTAELPRAALLPAIDRVRPNAEIVAEAAKGGDERAVIVTLRAGVMAHDLEQLRPFLTERLYKTLSDALPKNADRLYRHLDKYARAINEGFEIRVEKTDTPTTRQLVLKLKDGAELKPILATEHGTWKVERF